MMRFKFMTLSVRVVYRLLRGKVYLWVAPRNQCGSSGGIGQLGPGHTIVTILCDSPLPVELSIGNGWQRRDSCQIRECALLSYPGLEFSCSPIKPSHSCKVACHLQMCLSLPEPYL